MPGPGSERALRVGLISPIVSLLPGHPEWEVQAGTEELVQAAAAADELGYAYVTCSEHVGVPRADVARRGPRFYDPLATLSYLAAVTERIRLLTHIVVLPYHHPLAIAKRYGTLDALSGGRLILGCGVGSMQPEFELLGAPFEGRGAVYDDALEALRASLSQRNPSYRGTHFAFEDFAIDPCAVQPRVPIWLGGRTPRSLRRALKLGDGWVPFGLSPGELGELIGRAREWPEWKERSEPMEIALALDCSEDLSEPTAAGAVIDRAAALRDAGATTLSLTLRRPSLPSFLEHLQLFQERVMSRFAIRGKNGDSNASFS